ncbi:hypothetical protein METP2_03239 [Methanosarcinales archaeon]|nr:hypothetical protein METP2_03239 [Methanosarcinales archaeon]
MSHETDFHDVKALETVLEKKFPGKTSWINRSKKRLSDIQVLTENQSWLVEGIPNGDAQPFYIVKNVNGGITCQCYQHEFGVVCRTRVCTHVGAVLLFIYLENRDINDIIEKIKNSEQHLVRLHIRKNAVKEILTKFKHSKNSINSAVGIVDDVKEVKKEEWNIGAHNVKMIDGKYICIGPSGLDRFPCIHELAVMIYRREKIILKRVL